jgi:hypothetical protein
MVSLELLTLPGCSVTSLNGGHLSGSVDGKSGNDDGGKKEKFHR